MLIVKFIKHRKIIQISPLQVMLFMKFITLVSQ